LCSDEETWVPANSLRPVKRGGNGGLGCEKLRTEFNNLNGNNITRFPDGSFADNYFN